MVISIINYRRKESGVKKTTKKLTEIFISTHFLWHFEAKRALYFQMVSDNIEDEPENTLLDVPNGVSK